MVNDLFKKVSIGGMTGLVIGLLTGIVFNTQAPEWFAQIFIAPIAEIVGIMIAGVIVAARHTLIKYIGIKKDPFYIIADIVICVFGGTLGGTVTIAVFGFGWFIDSTVQVVGLFEGVIASLLISVILAILGSFVIGVICLIFGTAGSLLDRVIGRKYILGVVSIAVGVAIGTVFLMLLLVNFNI